MKDIVLAAAITATLDRDNIGRVPRGFFLAGRKFTCSAAPDPRGRAQVELARRFADRIVGLRAGAIVA